jgi:uncharacterized protein with beta-barrel porin domain
VKNYKKYKAYSEFRKKISLAICASPARNAFSAYVTHMTVFSFSRMVNNYLDNKRFISEHDISKEVASVGPSPENKDKKYNVWVNGFVDIAHQSRVDQNTYFNFTSEGVLIGFDYQGIPEADIGCAILRAFSQVTDGDRMGSSDIVYAAGSVYADYYWDDFYVNGAFWGVFHQIENRRNITYSDVDTKASGRINGWQIGPHLEAGHMKKISTYEFQPYVAVDYVVNWEASFTETGAGALDMHQRSQTSSMVQTVIGMKFFQAIEKENARLGFKEGVSYINRIPFGTGTVSTSIFGASDFVTLKSFTQTQILGAIEAAFFAELGKKRDVIISLGYEGQFGSEYISNEVILTLSKSF